MAFAEEIQLFVSSTFADMSRERDLLHKFVFPRVRLLCEENGFGFHPIDLRWGIQEEASRQHRVPAICLNSIGRVLRGLYQPKMLLLIGQRTGWVPLPTWLSLEHFNLLKRTDVASELFEKWYQCDDNSVPPKYFLLPTDAYPDVEWQNDAPILRSCLNQAANSQRDTWLSEQCLSLTEQEIRKGLQQGNSPLALIRTITNIESAPPVYRTNDEDAAGQERLRKFVRNTIPPESLLELSVRWEDLENGDLETGKTSYDQEMNEWLSNRIVLAIEKSSRSLSHQPANKTTETDRQWETVSELSANFKLREAELEKLQEKIRGNNPILLTGSPGAGKSTLLSRWAELNRNKDVPLFLRFVGYGQYSDSRSIFDSLLEEMLTLIGIPVPKDLSESAAIREFRAAMKLLSNRSGAVFCIDGADELTGLVEAIGRWLPPRLPNGISCILSARTGAVTNELERQLAPTLLELPPLDRDEGATLLDYWLDRSGRWLQYHQREGLLTSFAENGTPLWLRIAFDQAKKWASSMAAPELPVATTELINNGVVKSLLDPVNHLPAFTRCVLGLLTACRDGITDVELLSIVATDDDFWLEFDSTRKWELHSRAIPYSVWARLRWDLRRMALPSLC